MRDVVCKNNKPAGVNMNQSAADGVGGAGGCGC